jgi:light-regulated signal transduction histidine kinase (bacteriophytochrome)
MTNALNNGADAYLAEPVDPDVLVATVRAMLRLRRAERSLVTANRQLDTVNRELKRSNEDLESFAYIASHDLQEPLRTVTVFTQLLQRSLGDRLRDEEAANMEMVITAANRMRALLNDLLDYAQLGRGDGKYAQIALAETVKWATTNLSELIVESKATIHLEDLPVVPGDAAQLGHVFLNLISNAIKYRSLDRDPQIHISSEGSDVEVVVRVRDNGMGIEPQYLKQVFVPFKRLHGRQIPGNGIGLAVCQRIIEAHGGRVWAESELNVGSEFCFALPVNKES